MILNFNDWNQINEANIFSKIGDWFEKNFGTSYGKLQSLLSEYRELENSYIDEWEDINTEIDELELQRDQTKSDPAEQKKIQRLLTRNRELLQTIQKTHATKIDYIMKRVKVAIGDNQKLRNYWEMNKSKTDSEIAEEMYNKSKGLANKDLSDSLYRKYKAAVLRAKEKDEDFRQKFGDLARRNIQITPTIKSSAVPMSDSSIDLYTSMSLADFTKMVQSMQAKELKNLTSLLIKERNDLYLKMELEKESLNQQIDRKEIGRDEAAKRIKAIREMYMDKIRELRSKITVLRRNA